MHDDHSRSSSTKTTRRPLGVLGQRRQWGLDARTTTSKRLRSIMQDLAHQYGIPFDIGDAFLRRCGELVLTTEQTRLALIRHESGINIDHLLRLEGLTTRACRDLATRAKAAPSTQPTLEQYLQEQLQDDSEVAQ